jgi:rubrerythrin
MRVLDFAQEVDRSGQRFYQELSARAEHPGIRKIFEMLASDEHQLLERFRTLEEHQTSIARYDSEALNESINVFEKLLRQSDRLDIHDDVAAYQLAMNAEREVVQQYEIAAERETQPEVQQLLKIIAQVEGRELEEIEQLYHFTNAPSEFLEWGEFSNSGEFHNFGRDVDV